MITKIKETFEEIKARKAQKKAVRAKIRLMIETEGWRIIERDIKNKLRDSYQSLIKISPKELKEKQMNIQLALDFIEDIYHKAGLEWNYDGYKEIKETEVDGDIAKDQQLYQAWLESLSKQE